MCFTPPVTLVGNQCVFVKYKLSLIGKIVTVAKDVLKTTSRCGQKNKINKNVFPALVLHIAANNPYQNQKN